jgi:seryl-tRNA synthetase
VLDIKLIREKTDFVRARLATRGARDEIKIEEILKLDEVRRDALSKVEKLKNERNRVSREIGALMAKKELHAAEAKKLETKELGETIAHVDKQIAEIEVNRDALMLQLPNLPHESISSPSRTLNFANRSSWWILPAPRNFLAADFYFIRIGARGWNAR